MNDDQFDKLMNLIKERFNQVNSNLADLSDLTGFEYSALSAISAQLDRMEDRIEEQESGPAPTPDQNRPNRGTPAAGRPER